MIDSRLRKYFQSFFDVLARGCEKLGLTPDQLTVAALIVGAASALSILPGWYIPSLILLWLSGLLDVLDGSLARLKGTSSPSGAFMDMIFDRLVEVFLVIAFAVSNPEASLAVMVFLGAVIFNFSTFMLAGSLFSNNGEKSIHYDPGLAERTETFLVFSLMLIFPSAGFAFLWIFNILIIITGIRRFYRILRAQKNENSPSGTRGD